MHTLKSNVGLTFLLLANEVSQKIKIIKTKNKNCHLALTPQCVCYNYNYD